MDPLTHSLIGTLAGKTVKTSPRRVWIMTFLGLAPDLDTILGGFAFLSPWLEHRGLSHSLLGAFLQALCYIWLFKRWDLGPFKEKIFHYSLPLLLHVCGDLLTSYGVPLFLPFSGRYYSLDLVGSVTLIPSAFMAGALAWLLYREAEGWRRTRVVWLAWGLYLIFTFSEKTFAARLAPNPSENFTALPSLLSPFSWRGVALDEKAQQYRTYHIDMLNDKTSKGRSYPMPGHEYPVQASLKSDKVQQFLQANRWPVVRTVDLPQGWRVEWGTLIFSTRGAIRGKIAVTLNGEGAILDEKNIVTFWTPA